MKNWYCLSIRAGREFSVEHALKHDWHPYLPKIPIDERQIMDIKDKGKLIPMFPNYIFCELSPGRDDFGKVKETKDVHAFLTTGSGENRQPAVVQPELIWQLKALEDKHAVIPIYDFQKGEKVRLKTHKFDGYMAEILSVHPKKRLTVLLQTLTGQIRLKVGYRDVEAVIA